MKTLLSILLALSVAVLLPPVHAQAQERTPYTQAELDQMLAPVALYPDSLLSQVLMAATYPLEVVEAARWSRAHAGLKGEDAVRSAQDQDWDPSVKSLLAFPDLLARMDEKLDWTKRLGDAFLEQEPHVMETVQGLRRKAEATGQLASDERLRVVEAGGVIAIEPANPQVVYVPYYDPLVVYGAWGWPAYPPVLWAPWPGYIAYRPGIWWGVGIGISSGFFFGGVRWTDRHVIVTRANPYYARPPAVRRSALVHRPLAVGRWQHDPARRRGAAFRSPEVQRRFAPVAPPRTARPAAPRIERREPQREERRKERHGEPRGEFRAQPMPPAFRTSNPQPRVQAQSRNQAQPRTQSQPKIQAHLRTQSQPEIQAQPRTQSQPRIGAQQAQPRTESRPQLRGETRGSGNGNRRGRTGGWREKFGRGSGRN